LPRVIEKFKLDEKKGERTDRFFPKKSDGKTIALYLGLKLVSNGSIAVFCGRKTTAAKICKIALDIIERGISLALPLPLQFSEQQEVERLAYLHVKNLGAEALSFTKCKIWHFLTLW